MVAISAALEEFFGYGENYRNYRNTAERLKIEGWEFFQLTGAYRQFETHMDAYTTFAERVEQYIKQDVEGFISNLQERQTQNKQKTEETVKQNVESAMEKLNQQLQIQAQLEAKVNQLEEEKRSLEAQKQQLEQERLAQVQSNREKPAEPAAELLSEPAPEVSNVGINCHEEEDGNNSSVNGNSAQ